MYSIQRTQTNGHADVGKVNVVPNSKQKLFLLSPNPPIYVIGIGKGEQHKYDVKDEYEQGTGPCVSVQNQWVDLGPREGSPCRREFQHQSHYGEEINIWVVQVDLYDHGSGVLVNPGVVTQVVHKVMGIARCASKFCYVTTSTVRRISANL